MFKGRNYIVKLHQNGGNYARPVEKAMEIVGTS